METTGVWLLGWYLIGPFKVTTAVLFSISIETSGGPNVAIEIGKNISVLKEVRHKRQILKANKKR